MSIIAHILGDFYASTCVFVVQYAPFESRCATALLFFFWIFSIIRLQKSRPEGRRGEFGNYSKLMVCVNVLDSWASRRVMPGLWVN